MCIKFRAGCRRGKNGTANRALVSLQWSSVRALLSVLFEKLLDSDILKIRNVVGFVPVFETEEIFVE